MSTGPSDPGWSSLSDAEKLAWFQRQPPAAPPPPLRPRRGRRPLAIAALCIATVLVLVAGAWVVTRAAQQQHREQAAADAKATHKRAIATCRRQIGRFVADLRDINSQLDVGMNESDYGDAVRKASADSNDVVTSELSEACESAHSLADEALTIYAGIESNWNDCLYSDLDCDADTDVDFSGWTDAQDDIKEAYAAMLAGRMAGGTGTAS